MRPVPRRGLARLHGVPKGSLARSVARREEGCPSCSLLSDHIDGAAVHLTHRDVTLVAVSRAPVPRIALPSSLSLLMLTREKLCGCKSSVQKNDMNSHEVILHLPRTCPAGTPSEKF